MTKSVRFWRKKCIFIGRGKKNVRSKSRYSWLHNGNGICCISTMGIRRIFRKTGHQEIRKRFESKGNERKQDIYNYSHDAALASTKNTRRAYGIRVSA